MPLHYYHKKIIRLLGHISGKVIKIDYNTELATRGKFARIAVEVHLDRLLISKFLLDGKVQRVEYESLPSICFGCGRYGHTNSSCPEKRNIEPQNTNAEKPNSNEPTNGNLSSAPTAEKAGSDNSRYGPWMVVTRKGKNLNGKGKKKSQEYAQPQNGNSNRGSRFWALLMEDEGRNTQTEGGESSIAILSNQLPIPTDLYVSNGSKNSNERKAYLDSQIADNQPPRAQTEKKTWY